MVVFLLFLSDWLTYSSEVFHAKSLRSLLLQPEGGARKERKKKNKDKDPNKPKRPASAYMLWLNEHREEIKSENPSASITEIAKIGGQKWNELKDRTVKLLLY